MLIDVHIPVLREPLLCILCGECVDICPKSAIAYSFNNDREASSAGSAGDAAS